jgi:hypothetical protein
MEILEIEGIRNRLMVPLAVITLSEIMPVKRHFLSRCIAAYQQKYQQIR